jgi:hypothetical protein
MCGGGSTTATTSPVYYGPYGAGRTGSAQGQAQAQNISTAAAPVLGQAQAIGNQSAAMANQDAQNPGYGTGTSLYQNEAAGNYLNGSPALTNQEQENQASANRAAGDATAQQKSSMERAGMGFSTSNQEAAQNATAQQNANAMNTNAQLIGQNYENERNIQNQAPQEMNQNMANQVNMNQAGISALYSPLTAAANLNSSMWTGGQAINPDSTVIQQPGMLDYAGQILGML